MLKWHFNPWCEKPLSFQPLRRPCKSVTSRSWQRSRPNPFHTSSKARTPLVLKLDWEDGMVSSQSQSWFSILISSHLSKDLLLLCQQFCATFFRARCFSMFFSLGAWHERVVFQCRFYIHSTSIWLQLCARFWRLQRLEVVRLWHFWYLHAIYCTMWNFCQDTWQERGMSHESKACIWKSTAYTKQNSK